MINVNIPDANFKAYLIGNKEINPNGNTEILLSEAAAFTGTLVCSSPSIADLTGIEAFTALTILTCQFTQLTSLDVSQNTALTRLKCSYNQLTSLNVSGATALTELNCGSNQLTSLDVSQNTALVHLSCSGNQLTSLNVSQNTALTYLECLLNQLTSLDVSQNTALTYLACNNNQLTSLDLSQNTALTSLDCKTKSWYPLYLAFLNPAIKSSLNSLPKKTIISGNTFLFTGKLTEFTRESAEAHVKAEGGRVLSGVSDKLNYLVVGADAGSKLAKAKALNTVTILDEKEFLQMMIPAKEDGDDKPIDLNELKTIDLHLAKELLTIDSELSLLGVESITDEVAYILADYKGHLTIGCRTLSEKSAKLFGETNRNPEKNSLNLPNIEFSRIEGYGLDFFFEKGLWSANNFKPGIKLGKLSNCFFNDYPKINFNVERVVQICYALAAGDDYGLADLDETWFEEAIEEAISDGEEFQTFIEIGKMCNTFNNSWQVYFPDSLKSNLEFYNALAETCLVLPFSMIKLADKKILANRELMLKFLKIYSSKNLLEIVDVTLQDDKDFVMQVVNKDNYSFKYASERLRDDEDVFSCITYNYSPIAFASDRLKSKKDIAQVVLRNDGRDLQYFNDNIKKDKELVSIAVANHSSAFKYASNELLLDKDFLLSLLDCAPKAALGYLEYISEEFFTDKEFLNGLLENIYQNFLETELGLNSEKASLLFESFKKFNIDKDTIKKLIMISYNFVSEVPIELQSDLEIVKILVAKDISNFQKVHPSNLKNKEIITFLDHLENKAFDLMNDDDLLILVRYSEGVINYKNVQLFAKVVKTLDDAKLLVKKESSAYPHLLSDLKKDKVVVKLALATTGNKNLECLPEELLNDADYILSLLTNDPYLFISVPEVYKKDKNFVKKIMSKQIVNYGYGEMMRHQYYIFKYVDKSLQGDSELIDLVISKSKGEELECMENVPDSLLNKDFAMRLAAKGYCLQKFNGDRDILMIAIKNASYITVHGPWKNDLRVILAALSSLSYHFIADDFLKKHTNICNLRLLIEIQRIGNENKENDLANATEPYNLNGIIPEDDIDEDDYDEDDED